MIRKLTTYSGTLSTSHEVHCPESETELGEIFLRAKEQGHKLVFRGGGISFDSQSMGSDWVVSLEMFRAFELDSAQLQLTVGTGLPWGEILARIEPTGLLPGVVVSSSRASPGGTLSNNAHQRFSPTQGKEGDWIESLRMVTPVGEILNCSRTENRDLFCAAIGGLGWIGAVTSVTYRLQRAPGASWVETETEIVDGAERIVEGLTVQGIGPDWQGSYAPVIFQYGRMRAIVCRSRYPKPGAPRVKKRMILFQPWSLRRIPFELTALLTPWTNRFLWLLAFGPYYNLFKRFGDPLHDYTFFMDGHGETKRILRKLGLRVYAFQQAYVLPVGEFDRFLTQARAIWREAGLEPSMVDVIFLPKEQDPFLLSATHDREGIAFTITYESLSLERMGRTAEVLRKFARLCRTLGGRVQLNKNVFCDIEDLEAMYGPRLDAFFEVKRRTDPHFLLRNEFLERLFPKRVAAPIES